MQAQNSLDKANYTKYLDHYGIDIKSEEIEDLESLIDILYTQTRNRNIFRGFYVGYKIPQIGKEFDLLRFGKDRIINIELKSTSTEKIVKKQLKRNKYYLSYIEGRLYNLTFVSDTKKLYFLNSDDELEKVDFLFLENLLVEQKIDNIENADDMFNPSDYLVSPFNSTKKFLDNKYFLTNQQENIRNQITKSLTKGKTCTFISVTGSAGTGKTLLIYDIFKNLRKGNKKPLIIHCGILNEGQEILKTHGWDIIPIKNLDNYDLSKYDVIFIDEVQRIYVEQFKDIVNKVKLSNGCCIFSYDKFQTLAEREERNDIDTKINKISNIIPHNLSEKIRTNKEISIFIKSLFNKKRNFKLSNTSNIKLNYFKKIEDAKDYLGSLDGREWEVLRFTPSRYDKEHHEQYSEDSNKSSHRVIGQEFDNVAVTIDKFFSYDKYGILKYTGSSHYHAVRMLFQNITRTRRKLNLVIIDNDELLNRCLTILKN